MHSTTKVYYVCAVCVYLSGFIIIIYALIVYHMHTRSRTCTMVLSHTRTNTQSNSDSVYNPAVYRFCASQLSINNMMVGVIQSGERYMALNESCVYTRIMDKMYLMHLLRFGFSYIYENISQKHTHRHTHSHTL